MTSKITLHEINNIALKTLIKEMGITNTLRFMRQFSHGDGDYTEDRQELFKNQSIDDIIDELKGQRNT